MCLSINIQMFFGMIRQSCGGSDHPTANQFLYSYRLLSAKSLIKPPKRASVTVPAVQVLAPLRETPNQRTQTVGSMSMATIEEHIDELLQNDDNDENRSDSVSALFVSVDHDYYMSKPEQCILHYLGGYVAHKLKTFTDCVDCVNNLTDNQRSNPDCHLIALKTRGGLQIPSSSLTNLLSFLEQHVQKYSSIPHTNLYHSILESILASDELLNVTIGCTVHAKSLTARCVHFYVVARIFFIRKAINRNRGSNQEKHKLSKLSKLK